jgi:hypothetical protein
MKKPEVAISAVEMDRGLEVARHRSITGARVFTRSTPRPPLSEAGQRALAELSRHIAEVTGADGPSPRRGPPPGPTGARLDDRVGALEEGPAIGWAQ